MRLATILITASVALLGCGTKGPLEYPQRPGTARAAAPANPAPAQPLDSNKGVPGPATQ